MSLFKGQITMTLLFGRINEYVSHSGGYYKSCQITRGSIGVMHLAAARANHLVSVFLSAGRG